MEFGESLKIGQTCVFLILKTDLVIFIEYISNNYLTRKENIDEVVQKNSKPTSQNY